MSNFYICVVHCTMSIPIKQNGTSKSRWSFLAAPWRTKKASAQCHPQDWYLINRGGKKRAGLTRVNWINTFLPTMRRPFTGNNMKIRRIKSVWARTGDKVLPGHGVLFKQRPSGLERIWTSGPLFSRPSRAKIPFQQSLKFNLPFSLFDQVFRAGWLLVAVYSHNQSGSLIAITHRTRPVNFCSQAVWGPAINWKPSLYKLSRCAHLDPILSVPGHPLLPSYPAGHHQGQIGPGKRIRQKAQN